MAEFDYIITGAGSAGCVLAARLSEDADVKVLLIEAGGWDRHPYLRMPLAWRQIFRGPRFNWNFHSEPEPYADNRRIMLPRGKVMGGSSSINGMLYVRGHPRDYDLWAQAGCTGWDYAGVLPYFKRAEGSWRGEGQYHGGAGPLKISAVDPKNLQPKLMRDAAEAAGFPLTEDFCGPTPEGFGNVDLTVGDGKRASAARMYLHPALARPNLTVVTGALTEKVLIESGRATGVAYRVGGGRVIAHAAREVLVCGGAYNSPQILMLSGVGPADSLKAAGVAPIHDLPGVGQNLQEHPAAHTQFATKRPISFLNRLRFDRVALSMAEWMLFKTGDFATQALPLLGFVKSQPDLERPDLEIFCNPVRLDAEIWFPLVKPSQGHMLEGHASLMHPQSRGEVALRSDDPAAPPRIQLNILQTEHDRRVMREGLRICRRLHHAGPLADEIDHEVTPGEDCQSDADLDAHIRRVVGVGHHPVGTCAMGVGETAVVDPSLRVRGVEGLRVVDASIMPQVPGGNTNGPTIMLAEKAADIIRGRPGLAERLY